MKKRIGVVWVAAGLMAVAGGCGDGERGIQPTDTATTADTEVGDVAQGDVTAPAGDNACDADGDCQGGRSCRSGVCVADPPAGVTSTLTDPADNVPTANAPDLSCVDAAPAAAPVASDTATLFGAVARFGDGRKTMDVHVEVLLADGFDPSACEDVTGEEAQRDCYRTSGTVVGSALSVAPPEPRSLPPSCEGHEDCPLGYQCTEVSSVDHRCEEQFGIYSIDDVPTDTPLILRAWATTNVNRWHDTWTFNVVLNSDQVDDEGRAQYDATMVSTGQWLLTPNTVGLPPIAPPNGAIGGRVRDCRQTGAEARDSWPISEVSIDLETRARGVVYFNNLEDDTVPLIDRRTTNILGRFAALDIAPGWNRIAGSARVGDEVLSVGSVPVYVVPNALVIVSWPGRQPFWRQE